jgi:hypothetical protein
MISYFSDQQARTDLATITQEMLTKMGIINSSHIFADNAARDAYFVTNPTEMTTGLLISVGVGFQQFTGALWLSKTGIVQDTTITPAFESIIGTNKFNSAATSPTDGYYYNSSGVYSASASWATTGKIPCEAATEYIFSAGVITPVVNARFFNGATFLSGVTLTNNGSFTTPANCTHVVCNLFGAAHTTDQYNLAIAKGQLELGKVRTAYEAYSTQYVLKADAYRNGAAVTATTGVIQVKPSGNLYNKALAVDGMYIQTGNPAAGTGSYLGKIPVLPNTRYCLSLDEALTAANLTQIISQYDVNGAYLGTINTGQSKSMPFVTGASTYYISSAFFVSVAHTTEEFNTALNTIMLEYGTERGTTYQSYTEEPFVLSEKLDIADFVSVLSRFEKIRWAACGTSITAMDGTTYTNGVDLGEECHGYVRVPAQKLGLWLYNLGRAGSTLGNIDTYSFINKYNTYTWTDYDVATIEFAVNDLANAIHLGDPSAAASTTTFCGCLKTVLNYMLTANPALRIILCLEPDVTYTNNDLDGNDLEDFNNAIKNIAAQYRLTVCDWWSESGINSITRATLTADGLHPNEAGHERMGYQLVNAFNRL